VGWDIMTVSSPFLLYKEFFFIKKKDWKIFSNFTHPLFIKKNNKTSQKRKKKGRRKAGIIRRI